MAQCTVKRSRRERVAYLDGIRCVQRTLASMTRSCSEAQKPGLRAGAEKVDRIATCIQEVLDRENGK